AGDHRVAGEFDALPLQFRRGLGDGVLAHPGGEVEEAPRAETAAGRVHGGGADAVVGGDADDVDRVDAAGGEPVGERLLVVRDALEAAVAGRLAALAEHRLDGLQREVRVEVGAGRADHAVRRPRVDEVGLVGEVVARVEVEVAGRHDVVVVGAVLGDVPGDGGGHVRAALDGERAALAEVVLHVDDDQSLLAHEHSLYRSLLRTCPHVVDAIPGNGASSGWAAARSGAGAAVHELRGDGGLAPGEPDRRRRKLRDGPRVALPGRRERLAPDDLAVPHQRDLEDPIVRTRVRFTGGD